MICEGEGRKKTKVYSIGQITDMNDDEVTIRYFKRLLPSFHFLPTGQFYTFSTQSIFKVLPAPTRNSATKRRSEAITFETDFHSFSFGLV